MGATVTGEVLEQTKGKKLYIQKLRRRKNSRRRTGHRQKYTKVWISEISGDGFSVKASERSEIPVKEPAAEEPSPEDLAAEDLPANEQQPIEPPVEEAVEDAVESASDRADEEPAADEKKPQE